MKIASFKLIKTNFIKVALIFSGGVLIFLFQNCANYTEDINLDLDTETQASADQLSFAYDFTIDQIAYMSCKGASFSSGQTDFFSFRAGAYNPGEGIGFRESFLEDFGGLSDARLSQFLGISSQNADAGVVMSVRESGQMQSTLRFQEGTPGVGTSSDIAGLLYEPQQTLTDPDVSDILLKNKRRKINYLKGFSGGGNNKTFDGSINLFSVNDNGASGSGPDVQYRNLLQDRAYLAFTFATTILDSGGSPGFRARSPFSPTGEDERALSSVWGKGYQFNFSQVDNFLPGGSFRPSAQKRAVSAVNGYDLENEANLGENWVCPSDQKYIIVRPEDALRRFDGVPIDPGNHPFNQYDRVDPLDKTSAFNLSTTYNDGGNSTGGYYYSYRADYDGDGELDNVRHKVICPLVADQIPAFGGDPQEIQAWDRIRQILPTEDFYIFRGPKYNCIVPKNDDGNVCYGDGENIDESQRRVIQYFTSEDHPELRIENERQNRIDVELNPGADIKPEIDVTRDCGPGSSQSHGGFNFCPQVLSVCYKQ